MPRCSLSMCCSPFRRFRSGWIAPAAAFGDAGLLAVILAPASGCAVRRISRTVSSRTAVSAGHCPHVSEVGNGCLSGYGYSLERGPARSGFDYKRYLALPYRSGTGPGIRSTGGHCPGLPGKRGFDTVNGLEQRGLRHGGSAYGVITIRAVLAE